MAANGKNGHCDRRGLMRSCRFRSGQVLNLPVYLEADVQAHLTTRANTRGIEVAQLVNELLKKPARNRHPTIHGVAPHRATAPTIIFQPVRPPHAPMPTLPRAQPQALLPWALVAIGFAAVYIPSFIDLFNGIWATDQQGHGPIVLAVAAWLMFRRWPQVRATAPAPAVPAGWAVVAVGLLLYVLGRSQDILMFEIGSLLWLVTGTLLLFRGPAALKVLWFGLFFMLFMVPLPGTVVDALTQPMKIGVSYVAEQLMFAMGYPVSRSGVILQVGQYQLLVADACAGLQTLFVLEAMGLLYLNLVRHQSWVRNLTVALFIVPVSFAANVIRVVVLSLITYHWGDEAGQGFLHGFAGMVLFVAALLLIMGVDSLSRLLIAARPARVG